MKKVLSVSLGSSSRNSRVEVEMSGERIIVERIGTDGSPEKAMELLRESDGTVDAFGLGGTDLYIFAGGRRYMFRESARIVSVAKITPIVDGSGIKDTLERHLAKYLKECHGFELQGRAVLLVCAVDRFGMAEAFEAAGAKMVYGDLMFGLGLPVPIRRLSVLRRLISAAAPVLTRVPIRWLYPVGEKQNERTPRYTKYFDAAEVIAGDFHFIRRNMPARLDGKVVITNTVTAADEAMLVQAGIRMLVTTTPDMGGRSFGTNVLEAILVALQRECSTKTLSELNIEPRVKIFGKG